MTRKTQPLAVRLGICTKQVILSVKTGVLLVCPLDGLDQNIYDALPRTCPSHRAKKLC